MEIKNAHSVEKDTGSVTPNDNTQGISDKFSKGEIRMWEDVKKKKKKKDGTTVLQISGKADSKITQSIIGNPGAANTV